MTRTWFEHEFAFDDNRTSRAELADDEPPDDESALRSLSIVLVEPDARWRGLLTHVLEYYGALVFGAVDAREALETLDGRTADVLIADLYLPGHDGCWLIRELRRRTPLSARPIPAASISAARRAPDQERAISAGYQMHLEYPIEPLELVHAVLTLAARAVPGPQRHGAH